MHGVRLAEQVPTIPPCITRKVFPHLNDKIVAKRANGNCEEYDAQARVGVRVSGQKCKKFFALSSTGTASDDHAYTNLTWMVGDQNSSVGTRIRLRQPERAPFTLE